MLVKKDTITKICVMVLVSLLVTPIILTETVASSRAKTEEGLEKVTITIFDKDGKVKKIVKWLSREEIKDIKEELDKIASEPNDLEEKFLNLEVFLKDREIIPENFGFKSMIERIKEYEDLIGSGKANFQKGILPLPFSLLCFVVATGGYGQMFMIPCIPILIGTITFFSIVVIGLNFWSVGIPPAAIVTHSLLGTDLYVINPTFFLILGFVGFGISAIEFGNFIMGIAIAAFAVQ